MTTKLCETCHSPIPANAPGGLCPACVLRDAEEPPSHGRAAPSCEEIATAFPKLEILELIGQGGMGFVYKIRQPDLDRIVALKILSPELSRDPAFAERFAREARTLARLHHPNIVTVFEHGQSGGFFYLLMEYVDGVNLRQAMRAGRFTPEQAIAIVPGICDALQAAHAQGIWHRDIKPENILLDRDGRVKIADFGIARIVGDPHRDFTLTMTGNALGSAAYMAPEQHEKPHDVDHRADIYSLGVVIYEMLTGELPLGRFPLPSQRAEVNARIDEIVLRALTKERELRQQSADEVKTEVEGVGSVIMQPRKAPPIPYAPITVASLAMIAGGFALFVGAVLFTRGSTQGVLLAVATAAFGVGWILSWPTLLGMRRGEISFGGRSALRVVAWTTLIIAGSIIVLRFLYKDTKNWQPTQTPNIPLRSREASQLSNLNLPNIGFAFNHPNYRSGPQFIEVPRTVNETWTGRDEPIELWGESQLWIRARVIRVERGLIEAEVATSLDQIDWETTIASLAFPARWEDVKMKNGTTVTVTAGLLDDEAAEEKRIKSEVRLATEEVLLATRDHNSDLLQSRLSRSFPGSTSRASMNILEDFGDFDDLRIRAVTMLSREAAVVLVASFADPTAMFRVWMILEDGKWKVTEYGV